MKLLAVFLAAGSFAAVANASSIFMGTGTDTSGTINALVSFNVVCSPNCDLQIGIDNPAFTQSGNFGFGALISDLDFSLFNGTTALTDPGTLSDTITSNGISAPVTTVNFSSSLTNPATSTTTTKPASWQSSFTGGQYLLNDLTGGQPANMIIWSGPYSNLAPGFANTHNPSLAGTVVFTLDGIDGLTSTTTVSDVSASFGSGPDASISLDPCPTCCPAGLSCGSQGVVPEPFSLGLTGGGLILLAFFRKKIGIPR